MSPQVTAVLKGVFLYGDQLLPGADGIDEFSPRDPRHFGLQAQVFVSEPGSEGADSFDVWVCSPSWFAEHAGTDDGWSRFDAQLTGFPAGVLPGAGIWFMRQWDPSEFERAVLFVCTSASGGPDWGSVASRIGRLIPWEFSYRYDDEIDSGRCGSSQDQ